MAENLETKIERLSATTGALQEKISRSFIIFFLFIVFGLYDQNIIRLMVGPIEVTGIRFRDISLALVVAAAYTGLSIVFQLALVSKELVHDTLKELGPPTAKGDAAQDQQTADGTRAGGWYPKALAQQFGELTTLRKFVLLFHIVPPLATCIIVVIFGVLPLVQPMFAARQAVVCNS